MGNSSSQDTTIKESVEYKEKNGKGCLHLIDYWGNFRCFYFDRDFDNLMVGTSMIIQKNEFYTVQIQYLDISDKIRNHHLGNYSKHMAFIIADHIEEKTGTQLLSYQPIVRTKRKRKEFKTVDIVEDSNSGTDSLKASPSNKKRKTKN